MEAMEPIFFPPHVPMSRPIGSHLLKYPSHAFLKRFLWFVREGPCLKKRPPPQQSHELQVDNYYPLNSEERNIHLNSAQFNSTH
jgi:hypothetical protein